MPLKKFVFRQISRYICTRRIQFTLQNLHIVFFSNNDDVICCFIGRAKTYLLWSFSIFLFNDFTERLVGCLYKCGCLVKFSIRMSIIRKNSFFQSLRACTPTFSFLHHRLQYDWSASSTILRHLVKSILDGSLYLGPFSKSDLSPLSWIQLRSPVTTWPAGGYRNGESAQYHDDWMEFRTSGSEVTWL